MFKYQAKQKVCNIGGVKVGGQLGENPPLLIGNMFQKGDLILEDQKRGKVQSEQQRKSGSVNWKRFLERQEFHV